MNILNGTVEMQDVGLLAMAGLLAAFSGNVLIAVICGALAGDSIQRLVWPHHWPTFVSRQAAIATQYMEERQKADEAEARRVNEAAKAKPQDSTGNGQPTFELVEPGQWCATEHGKDGDMARIIRAADEAEARRICREKGLRFDGRLVSVARGLDGVDLAKLIRELELRDRMGVRGRQ